MKAVFTTAQLEARTKAIELLAEHFEHYVILVESDVESPSEPISQTAWLGTYQGASAALGLMEKYKHDLLFEKSEDYFI